MITSYTYTSTRKTRTVTAFDGTNSVGHITWEIPHRLTEYEVTATRQRQGIGLAIWDWMLANVPHDEQPNEPLTSKYLSPEAQGLMRKFLNREGRPQR